MMERSPGVRRECRRAGSIKGEQGRDLPNRAKKRTIPIMTEILSRVLLLTLENMARKSAEEMLHLQMEI
jgi:hypothetical protein